MNYFDWLLLVVVGILVGIWALVITSAVRGRRERNRNVKSERSEG